MKLERLDTLTTRFILIVTVSLIVAQLISIFVFREVAGDFFESFQRTTQITRTNAILDEIANDQSSALAPEFLNRHSSVLVMWTSTVPGEPGQGVEVTPLSLSDFDRVSYPFTLRGYFRPINSYVTAGDGHVIDTGNQGRHHLSTLHLSIETSPGAWLNFVIESAPRTRPPLLPFIILISATFLTVASAAGFATWQTSQPVKDLAVSSQRLGLGETHVPVKVSGPYDVRKAIRKFNTMGKRLETTLASQRDVLVAIGHDLRTPLTSLRVRVASLQDSEEQGNMNRALDELERLMDAALEIGKKELPKTPRERIDAGALIHSLSEDLRTIGVDVDFIEPEELIVVDGWTIELTRALRNLIENAVRYGTKAKVQIRPTNSAIQFIVQDNGPGIPPDQLERVFEPLYRVERSRSTDTGGHGLGLSIAMKIARTHNGDILLENMSGGGLQATLIIPKSGAE